MAEVLIIGGGGAGGYGGGGAGGVLYFGAEAPKPASGAGLTLLAGTTYTITVGAGGIKGTTDGGNSSLVGGLHNLIAVGGGRGANGQNPINGTGNTGANVGNGSVGGSGGGGGHNGSASTLFSSGGLGTDGQGSSGGGGGWYGAYNGGGGGGGAGGAGASGGPVVSLNVGGKGGDGLAYAITGTAIYYAPGGGGAYGGAPGRGGTGISGADSNALATAPKANVGQGGNGANCYGLTRASGGGSGVVIIRTTAAGAKVTGSPTLVQDGAYFVYIFTGSGTYAPTQNENDLFTPAEVDRALWINAAGTLVSNAATGAVSNLYDLSGWGRNLVLPSIASPPVKSSDNLRLSFTGGARLESYQKGPGRGVSALSMFALVSSTSEATQLVQAVTARFADIMAGIMINESSNPGQISAVARRSPTDTLAVTPLGEFVQGEQTLVYAFWDFAGGTCGGAMNAAGPISVGLSGSSGPTLDSLRGFCLGGTQRGEYPLVGSWAGAVVLEHIPSLSERQRLEGYLAWLINDSALLPEGHPYRVSPPESIGPAVVAVVPAIAPPQVSMAGSLIVDASGITAPTYRHRLAGTVTILDKPVRRRVVVTHRITEELIAVTESDPVTGAWEVTHLPQYPEKMLLVTAFDDMGQYNAVPADFITQVEG